jgi:hypothetical protein
VNSIEVTPARPTEALHRRGADHRTNPTATAGGRCRRRRRPTRRRVAEPEWDDFPRAYTARTPTAHRRRSAKPTVTTGWCGVAEPLLDRVVRLDSATLMVSMVGPASPTCPHSYSVISRAQMTRCRWRPRPYQVDCPVPEQTGEIAASDQQRYFPMLTIARKSSSGATKGLADMRHLTDTALMNRCNQYVANMVIITARL